MTYARRVDANQADIIKAMEKVGAVVTPLYRVGQGVADLLVSFRQKWFLMECKVEKGELTEDQVEWIGKQRAPVYVVTSPLQAIGFLQDVVRP